MTGPNEYAKECTNEGSNERVQEGAIVGAKEGANGKSKERETESSLNNVYRQLESEGGNASQQDKFQNFCTD